MAEGEQIQWFDGRANVPGIVEKLSPKKHVRQGQWKREWNQMYLNDRSPHCYDYISDYECIFNHPIDERVKELYIDTDPDRWDNLQAAKRRGTKVPITNLAHFTTYGVVGEIIRSGGFQGGLKKIDEDTRGNAVRARFSWWIPRFSEDDMNKVRDSIGAAIEPFLHLRLHQVGDDAGEVDDDDDDDQLDDQDSSMQLRSQFATSDAFIPNPKRYGRFFFRYGINDLCHYYSNHFEGEVQFKILGTFGYKKEVMHAVLVCSEENGAGMFAEYPDVLTPDQDIFNEAVVTRDDDGNWVWKPQATGTVTERLHDQTLYPEYRRWEQVAFAFHIPDELKKKNRRAQITVDDLENHVYEIVA